VGCYVIFLVQVKSGRKMPSKRQYDLVQNDDYDTRIPLHPEEAFHHGITFQTKVNHLEVVGLEVLWGKPVGHYRVQTVGIRGHY